MKTNEFKCGNWVMYNDQNTEPIPRPVQIDVPDLILIQQGVKECVYAPIPLTPEILVKCGFEWSIYHKAYHKQGFIFDLSDRFAGGFVMHESKGKQQIICPEILWLHQLQNLYFALTGTELEVNL